MKVIGERVLSFLKADTTLVNLLGGATHIYAKGLSEPETRFDKFITVECSLGEDFNYTKGQSDVFDVEVCVSRNVENAFSTLMTVVDRVDGLLNQAEASIATSTWKIISLYRDGTPTKGAAIDEKFSEYYFQLRYNFILDENV